MPTKPFYNHISGLRGAAILMVMLFHLNPLYFPHGYYGVDIFLTISGYLLFLSFTRSNNHLDFKEFATKKLLRIFPPLLILVLAVLLVSIYMHDWEDILMTARSGRHAIFCDINKFLRRTQEDYFAANALENPFLHLWYLAVTIQLYLTFAAGAILHRYIPRKIFLSLLWISGIASFCYGYSYHLQSILQATGISGWGQEDPISHYDTLPRVWEMLAGGAILLLPTTESKIKANLLSIFGLAAAIIPPFVQNSIANYTIPMVVLGTMLIIRYLPASSLMSILSNKVLLWVGGISFSLYLVHMPIIAFYRTWNQNLDSISGYTLVIGLSIVMSILFYLVAEKRRFRIITTLILWGIAMLLCIAGQKTQGYKNILRKDINAITIAPYNDWIICGPDVLAEKFDPENLAFTDGVCDIAATTRRVPKPEKPMLQIGPESKTPQIVLMGDSHAQSAYFGLNAVCQEMNKPGILLAVTVIPFWDKEFPGKKNYCFNRARAEALLTWLEANPSITHVVLAQHWRLRMESKEDFIHWDLSREKLTEELLYNALREFVIRVNALDKHVIILGPGPELPVNSPTRHIRMVTRQGVQPFDLSPITSTWEFASNLNKDAIRFINRLKDEGLCSVLDAMSIIQPDKPFCAYEDGKFLMKDDDHLTSEGSIRMFRHLKPQLETFLKQKKPQLQKQ